MPKNILLFFLVFSCSLFAQVPDTTSIPAHWKNESIILLDYDYSIRVNRSGGHEEKIRMVYYLRDKWGLDEVSQISLPGVVSGKTTEKKIGTVYKRNGKQITIDTTQLIPRKSKINFNNATGRKTLFSVESNNGQKLAVPSLEVGDILEIHYETKISDAPTIIPLVTKFCALNYAVDLWIETVSSYRYGTYYATIVVDPLLMNTKATFKSQNENSFSIKQQNVEKYKEEILNDNLSQIPYVLVKYKYKDLGVGNNSADREFVKMSEEEMKKDQMTRVRQIYYKKDKQEKALARRISGSLKKKHPKIEDTLSYVRDAYYLYREIIGGDYLYAGYNKSGYKGNLFFVNVMGRVLGKKGIKNKVFLSQENHYGGTSKQSDFLEPVHGIVIPHLDFYLFNPLYNLEPGNVPSHFENQTYVSFTANKYYKKNRYKWWLIPLGVYTPIFIAPNSGGLLLAGTAAGIGGSVADIVIASVKSKKKRKYDYKTGHFPLSQPNYNQISTDVEIKDLKTNGKPLEIETKNSFYGKMKINELRKLNNYSDIYNMEKNIYKELIHAKTPVQDAEAKTNEAKTMKKLFVIDLKDDGFDVDKVTSYNFDQANFFNTSAPLKYSLNYTAKNILVESGDYLILNAGHLIGEQLNVNERNSERTQDFYIPYQKQFTKQITIHIPAGYTVQNIEDFTVSKETTAGKFVSKAYVDGGKVVINTTKTYAFQYYDKDDVDDIYSFLIVAEHFRNKRLVLKK
ncbi:MAG: hypothetical protein K0S33_4189 [Bacteroidetes bacterium]|jgi:hypothetical protein|nr:hypothetical protein [Bacteroidota bacterium]